MDKKQELIERLETEREIGETVSEEIKEEEIEEEIEEQNDVQQEIQGLEPGAIPHQEEQQNTLKFLKEILEGEDRFKTAYLTWEELGKPTFSTRFWLNLSNTCKVLFNFELVAAYCRNKAAITSDTSLSREGFIISTSVTQRKLKEKKSNSELADFLKKKQ